MSNGRKYELLQDETKEAPDGTLLYRIRALRDVEFSVEKGECGGYIASEKNLSHSGESWVYDNGQVFGSAWVADNAWVSDNAWVFGNARLYGKVRVRGNSRVFGFARLNGDVAICAGMRVCDSSSVVWFTNVGSECGTLTVATGADGGAYVTRGCFSGTLLEFLEAVNERHGDSAIGHEYRALIAVACSRLGISTPSSITPLGGAK